MLSLEFQGRGLFVFSDPAGAKAILSYVKISGVEDYQIVSDRIYDFYSEFELKVEAYKGNERAIIEAGNFGYLIAATSYTSKIELKFLMECKTNNIPSFSFIDHYTRFWDRFDFGERHLFPDYIGLIDKKAEQIALNEGLDKQSQLIVTGNFYHNYLKQWSPKISREEVYKRLALDPSKKLVIFAPEPLSNVLGAKEKFGFDEIETTAALVSYAREAGLDANLVFTPHPNQNMSLIAKSDLKHFVINSQKVGVIELTFHADLIIGMFSNFLIEAQFMGKKVLRFFCKPVVYDPLRGMTVGEVVNNNSLKTELEKL